MSHLKNVILDSDPDTKHLWSSWDLKKATIHGNVLTIVWPHGTLEIEAVDAQLVADMFFAHESKGDFVKGKLGIQRISYTEKTKSTDLEDRLRSVLKELLREE